MAEHTPGPFKVGFYQPTENFKGIPEHAAVMDSSGLLIAVTGPTDDPSSRADAQLFAAAPYLLSAAETVLTGYAELKDTDMRDINALHFELQILAEAVAKARGQS